MCNKEHQLLYRLAFGISLGPRAVAYFIIEKSLGTMICVKTHLVSMCIIERTLACFLCNTPLSDLPIYITISSI